MYKKHPLIKKNDKVIVQTGKEKGKIGTVLKVDAEKGRVIVEKINMVKRHTRAGEANHPGRYRGEGIPDPAVQPDARVQQVCRTHEDREADSGGWIQGADLQEMR